MHQVHGPRQPVDASSKSSANRDDRTAAAPDRDVPAEGRRFSQLLRNKSNHHDSTDDQAPQHPESKAIEETEPVEDTHHSFSSMSPHLATRRQDPQQESKPKSMFEDDARLPGEKFDSTGNMPKKGSDPTNLSDPGQPIIAGEHKIDREIPQDIDWSPSTLANKDAQKHFLPKDHRSGPVSGNTGRAISDHMGDQILQGLLGRGIAGPPDHLPPLNKTDKPLSGAPDWRDTLQENDRQRDDRQDTPADKVARAGGDQILQGMLNPPMANDQTVSKPPDTISNQIADLANRVAERVLVSDRSENTDSTVRIQLRASVLAGSEISIHRDQGQLVVSFNVPDSTVGQQLRAHADDLQRQLSDKIQQPVNIQVNVGSNASDSGGDGRSRNRRDISLEWQPDE